MKASIPWLKELVDLNCSVEELVDLLPLRTIGTKEVTEDFIELDMKGYNRADLLSMRGVAQEVSAITGSNLSFKEPEEAEFVWNNKQLPQTRVEIKDPQLCPFYSVAKIEGLKVEQSDETWVKKLSDSGIRSVNNIADVTNLVMLEYGQPLHAFDAKKVENEEIIVRVANEGGEITTLDGKKRILSSTDLLIADPKKALGLAGVMGGKNSEVTNSTTTILLEAAIFDPINIRKTTTSLGLPSEASKRFQHGLTKIRLLQGLNAAIKMYESLGGKVTAIKIVGNTDDKTRKITLTQEKLDKLTGIKIDPERVEEYLTKLNFKMGPKFHSDNNFLSWEVEPPYFRLDMEIEEDVIEEIARMYGYEKIPPHEVRGKQALQKEDPIFQKISDLKNKLVDLGLTEIQTYSFYSTAVLEALEWNNQKMELLVKIANPISSETEYLRQSIWPNLLEVVGKNIRKGYKDIAVFEIGKAFTVDQDGNPVEDYTLAIALMNGTDNPLEELVSMANVILGSPVIKYGVNSATPESKKDAGQVPILSGSRQVGASMTTSSPPEVATHLFHPKRFLSFEKNGESIGELAEVHLRVLNKLGIEKRVAVLEIEL